jgi:dTDP-4-amino-4,6-dideoxygalactose transaminase
MSATLRIPFARVVCDGRELEFVKEVLESGWLTTAGKALEFERRFAEYVGAPAACAVNSCTAALHLALEALGVGAGDKVLVPTWTFTATAEVIRYLGADPILVDVDYGTSLLRPEILRQALEAQPEIKVAMIVHFGGQAVPMTTANGQGILNLCHARGVKVVEDAAHAFPARWRGRMVGSLGDITCFSFYANKTITTGEGGMVTTADEAVLRRCKIMRLHGIDRDVWQRFTADKPTWEYDVVAPGYKYNLPDINAAVGLAQLERAAELRRQRQRCAEHYYERLAKLSCLDLPVLQVPVEDHAWHLFPIILRPEAPVGRDRLIELLAERGIGTSVHYKPIHRLRYYREKYDLDPAQFPNAERLWRGCISLPIYPSLKDDELDYITGTLTELLAVGADATGQVRVRGPSEPPGMGVVAPPRTRIHLSVPHMSGSEETFVREAFASNWLSTVGPNLSALEHDFAERLGLPSVVVASGTAAIQLALRLAGVRPGDEVVSPTLTFVASCNPIRYLGAYPVLIDSERTSWNLDPQRLAEWLAGRAARGRLPKAVVVVHLFGQPADMDPILECCRRYEVVVVEDAAESLGALYKGRRVGTFGEVTAFSFNGNKVITATAGGMLSSPRQAWVDRARHWSTQACDPDPLRNYVHSEIGYNYRMSNVLAGIARGQLSVLDLRIRQRRAVFDRYQTAFAELPGIRPMPEAAFGFHIRWLSCFLIDEVEFGCSAAELVRFLEAANVEARPVWKPMHLQPLYRGCEQVGGDVAEDLNRRGICLPSSSSLTAEEQGFVIDRVRAAHQRARA